MRVILEGADVKVGQVGAITISLHPQHGNPHSRGDDEKGHSRKTLDDGVLLCNLSAGSLDVVLDPAVVEHVSGYGREGCCETQGAKMAAGGADDAEVGKRDGDEGGVERGRRGSLLEILVGDVVLDGDLDSVSLGLSERSGGSRGCWREDGRCRTLSF